jgi:hypothetical protein
MQRNGLAIAFFLCACSFAFAQPIRVRLDEFPQRAQSHSINASQSSNFRLLATPLTLPFWEDFSYPPSFSEHFQDSTGVYVNNHLCINQPSVNVATFDGLDYKGKPYYTSNVYQMGSADSLISREIDLSTVGPQDSLYFSFLYEIAGYGEVPELVEGDSLILQFFTKQGYWKSVWQSSFSTTTDSSKFYPVLFKVLDSNYFHSGFKFKFLNYARLSGLFDLWHVDYIVMDTIKHSNDYRSIKDGRLYFSDQAISKSPTSILSTYQSIPFNHLTTFSFLDNFTFTVSNLSFNSNSFESTYILQLTSASSSEPPVQGAGLASTADPGIFVVSQPFSATGITPVNEEFQLTNKVFLTKTFGDTLNYKFTQNDTVTSVFPYKDFYAYDDGTYEYGVMFEQDNALQAVAYDAYKADTLTDIDICLPHIGYNISGTPDMILKVWADNGGKPGEELYSRLEQARYNDSISSTSNGGLNPFTRYTIKNKTVIVGGRFYVGFQQLYGFKRAIRMGFDVNNSNKDKFWYDNNRGNGWSQYRNLDGSMMIRPVFQNNALNVITVDARLDDSFSLQIFPNPNQTGILSLNEIFDKIQVSDTKGQIRLNIDNTDTINLSELDAGVYFVKGYLDGKFWVKRLIYQRN